MVNYSFSETFRVATVLLISELKLSNSYAIANTLIASFPDDFYLASEQPFIPSFYYAISSVATDCEQGLAQAKETLSHLGVKLGILPERCLLLFRYLPHFSKWRLQRQLVRLLKCPVRLLVTEEDKLWLHLLELSGKKPYDAQSARSRLERGIEETVKRRYLASSVVF